MTPLGLNVINFVCTVDLHKADSNTSNFCFI